MFGIEPQFTAAHAPHQHGLLEQLHEHLRVSVKCAWAELTQELASLEHLQSLLVEVSSVSNDLPLRDSGVSPNMLAFGRSRRDLPNFGGGLGEDTGALAHTLHDTSATFRRLNLLRETAR